MARLIHSQTRTALLAGLALAAIVVPQGLAASVVSIPFDVANFSDPLDIDNQYLPMVPGMVQTYKADAPDGCEVDVVTVTSDTKAIAAGVTARVVYDVGYEDPECNGTLELHEATFDWFAQDNAGNVWYMGEASSNCTPAGCTPSGGSWEAGVDGAVAGIIMLANPHSGDQYYQEYYVGHAEDQAKVTSVGVKVVLKRDDAFPPGSFSNCIKTKEWSALDTGSPEQKYYCPGIGNVAVDEHHGKVFNFELVDAAADALKFRTIGK